eukprot:CAMPEP_0119113522 /NCGR_PEP_ID=MMETSP1180-20130426/44309_1 /TAXON_ID=3052 ORGANISM="Chlamydomonas cf sp, Strain CCMP681" /NCGR_SAMPLE_ID=MMETSP1180 /ASSEMBLY_ACC=CAM_ASM_000741 /LENGTH=50 /DNA_ID=CAMNT_0007101659 /DNA_START=743 /DNA_END=895 /DNA_ORIENTATION=-
MSRKDDSMKGTISTQRAPTGLNQVASVTTSQAAVSDFRVGPNKSRRFAAA